MKAHDLYQDVIYHEAQEGGVEYESLYPLELEQLSQPSSGHLITSRPR